MDFPIHSFKSQTIKCVHSNFELIIYFKLLIIIFLNILKLSKIYLLYKVFRKFRCNCLFAYFRVSKLIWCNLLLLNKRWIVHMLWKIIIFWPMIMNNVYSWNYIPKILSKISIIMWWAQISGQRLHTQPIYQTLFNKLPLQMCVFYIKNSKSLFADFCWWLYNQSSEIQRYPPMWKMF